MKNYILISITFIFFLISCNYRADRSKIVLITSNFPDSTLIFLTNIERETKDSGYIVNNLLEFIVDIDEPTNFCITPIIKTRADIDYFYFWKENSKVTIHAQKGNLKLASIEGSEIQKQAQIVRDAKAILEVKLDSLIAIYRTLPFDSDDERSSIRKIRDEIENSIIDVDVNYIKNNPNELYSIITLKNLRNSLKSKDLVKELYYNLNPTLQVSKYGLVVKKYIDTNANVSVGDTAINFQLLDIYGNLVELKNFEGKYVLLDFWASNCGPCRIENPHLLKYYKTYRDRGFEIIGISLDKNKATWGNTVKSDSMIWTNVSDLKGVDGDVPIIYNINMMPTYFIISPEGIVIDKIEGRGQLEEKLKNIFDS